MTNVNEFTPEQLADLKSKNGPMFKTTLCGVTYLCKLLYSPDWNIISQLREDNPKMSYAEIDERIVSTALIAPIPSMEDGGWSAVPAGVIPSLSALIRAKSGFSVPELPESMPITEDLDNDVEMEKPDEKTLAALKANARYGLKGIAINNDYYVVRPITRVEFKQVMQTKDQSEQDRGIVEKVVMWPKGVNWDEKGAGYCDTIAQYVLAVSGYAGPSAVEDI